MLGQGFIGFTCFSNQSTLSTKTYTQGVTSIDEIESCSETNCGNVNANYCWYVKRPNQSLFDFIPVTAENLVLSPNEFKNIFGINSSNTGIYKFVRVFHCMNLCNEPNASNSSNEVTVIIQSNISSICSKKSNPFLLDLSKKQEINIIDFSGETERYSFKKEAKVEKIPLDCEVLKKQESIIDSFWIYDLNSVSKDSCLSYVKIVNNGYCFLNYGSACDDKDDCTQNSFYDSNGYCISKVKLDSIDYKFMDTENKLISIVENLANCKPTILICYAHWCVPCQEIYQSHNKSSYPPFNGMEKEVLMLEFSNAKLDSLKKYSFDFITNNSFQNIIDGGEDSFFENNCVQFIPKIFIFCPNTDSVVVFKGFKENTQLVINNYIKENCRCIPCNYTDLKPTITYPREICSNETKTIIIAPIANTTIKAKLVTDNTSIQGDENINFSNPQQIMLNLKNTSSTTQSLSIKISVEKDGCVFDSIISISVNPELIVNIQSNKDTINLIEKTNLTASGLGGSGSYIYLWQPNGSSASSVLINNTPLGVSKAIVNIKDNKGCEARDSIYLKRITVPFINTPDQSCLDSVIVATLSDSSFLDKIKFDFQNGQIINGTNGDGIGPHEVKFNVLGFNSIMVKIENRQENNYLEIIDLVKTIIVTYNPYNTVINCNSTVNTMEFSWLPNSSIIKVNPIVVTGQSGILSGNSFKLINLSEEEVTVEFEFETTTPCSYNKLTKTCKTKPCGPAPIFQNTPSDITISCNNLTNLVDKVKILDGCTSCPEIGEVLAQKNGQADVCGGELSYLWQYTDECNRTISHAQKITVVPSSIPLFISPPSDITISCEEIIKTPQALSYSNIEIGTCIQSGNIVGTITGSIPEKCGGAYTIRWQGKDLCNRDLLHEQKVTVLPVMQATFEPFEKEITVPCDEIPEVKLLKLSNSQSGICEINENVIGQKIEITKPKEEGLECKGKLHFVWKFIDVCNRIVQDSQVVTLYTKKMPIECITSEDYIDTIMCEEDVLYLNDLVLSKDNDRVTLKLIDRNGCDSLLHYRGQFVNYLCKSNCNDPENFYFPTGFSPNDDGINDEYEILGLEECKESLKDRHIRIINRWGTLVYENKSYDNSWNGTDNNGNPLPVGTYYFDVVLDDLKNIKKNGYVVIIR